MGRMLSFGSGSVVFFVVIFDAGRPGALTGHYVVCKAGGCLKKKIKKTGLVPFPTKATWVAPTGLQRCPNLQQTTAPL